MSGVGADFCNVFKSKVPEDRWAVGTLHQFSISTLEFTDASFGQILVRRISLNRFDID